MTLNKDLKKGENAAYAHIDIHIFIYILRPGAQNPCTGEGSLLSPVCILSNPGSLGGCPTEGVGPI